MEKRGWWEWGVVGGLIVVLLVFLVPALLHARAERRDGIRRQEVRQFKQLMEERNNELGFYPYELDASPHVFVVTEGEGQQADGWYLRAELENQAEPTAGFDEEYNVYYRVVREDEKTYYDICGGTLRCGVEDHEL